MRVSATPAQTIHAALFFGCLAGWVFLGSPFPETAGAVSDWVSFSFGVCNEDEAFVSVAMSTVDVESVFQDAGLGTPALSSAAAIFPCWDIVTVAAASSAVRRITSLLTFAAEICEGLDATAARGFVGEDSSLGVACFVPERCSSKNPRINRNKPRRPQRAARITTTLVADKTNGRCKLTTRSFQGRFGRDAHTNPRNRE